VNFIEFSLNIQSYLGNIEDAFRFPHHIALLIIRWIGLWMIIHCWQKCFLAAQRH
jgi:putative Mn2+ efflux pump MntP